MTKHHSLKASNIVLSCLKIGVVMTLFCLLVKPAIAQDTREELNFGIKAGTNYSNVWDEQGQDFRADAKFGFAAGAWLGIPIGRYLGIQPEIQVAQKGFEGGGTLLGSEYTVSKTTTHLEVPLLVQFKPASFVTIVGGPHYSFLLSEKDSFTWGANEFEQEQEFDNDNIRKNIFGFAVGADFIFDPFVLSARAGWDVTKNHGDGSSSTPQYKNQWIQLMAGFQF